MEVDIKTAKSILHSYYSMLIGLEQEIYWHNQKAKIHIWDSGNQRIDGVNIYVGKELDDIVAFYVWYEEQYPIRYDGLKDMVEKHYSIPIVELWSRHPLV